MGQRSRSSKNKPVVRHRFVDAKDWLHFVELDPFGPAWKRLGLDDDDLRALQLSICSSPDGAPVVAGSGGLRKLRFAPPRWNIGRSGATRVYYSYFAEHGLVALIYVHSKAEMEAISAAEKRVIRDLIQDIQRFLNRRRVMRGRTS